MVDLHSEEIFMLMLGSSSILSETLRCIKYNKHPTHSPYLLTQDHSTHPYAKRIVLVPSHR